MKRSVVAIAALVVVSLVVVARLTLLAQTPTAGTTTDAFIGLWKLNLQKSSYSPGPKPAAGHVQVFEWVARPDGFIAGSSATIGADGVPGYNRTLYKYDGKDYPWYSIASLTEFMATGTKSTNTFAFRLTSPTSVEIISKQNGQLVNQTRTRTVSADGKTMTDTNKGTNAQGQPFTNILVFDRIK